MFAGVSQAELRLASPFTDHAVLQRDQVVPVWGRASAGAEVSVQFAGQSTHTRANAQGHWRLELQPMKGSHEGRPLVVKSNLDGEAVCYLSR